MYQKTKYVSLFFLILGVGACSSTPEIVTEKEEEIKEELSEFDMMAKEILGDEAKAEECSTGEYVLVSMITPASQYNPNDTVSFSIVKAADKSVVYERKDYFGSVQWYDDHRLELIPAIGIVKAEEGPSSKFRLVLNARTGLMEETQRSK